MEKLRQDIRANQFERVYLLYGEERYLVQMYKNQLKKAIIGDDTMNLNQYTGKGLPVQEVENAVMTMPFFADRRLVRSWPAAQMAALGQRHSHRRIRFLPMLLLKMVPD